MGTFGLSIGILGAGLILLSILILLLDRKQREALDERLDQLRGEFVGLSGAGGPIPVRVVETVAPRRDPKFRALGL